MKTPIWPILFASTCVSALAGSIAVSESQRQIPVAYDVDVVVVGGSSGAASAAIAAAETGAKVFLLAPRPFLGDDMCDTRRLWLEDGEVPLSPLGKKLFSPEAMKDTAIDTPVLRDPNSLNLAYTTSIRSAAKHKDSTPPSKLTDGLWVQPSTESVQYDGEVVITADLGVIKEVKDARIIVFHRDGDFACDSVLVETSQDQRAWKKAALLRYSDVTPDTPILLSATVTNRIRYARFTVNPGANVKRVLIGEIMLVAPDRLAPKPSDINPRDSSLFTRLVRPMHVKRTLDEALLEAKVDFLFSCFATELLRDGEGKPCGVVMANRAGRQAVLAKVIIDATPRATVARMAGAEFYLFPAREETFTRITMGGEPRSGANFTSRKLDLSFKTVGGKNAPANREAELIEYTLRLPMRNSSFASFAEADQFSRDLLWQPAQLDIAEALFQVPPDPVRAAKSVTSVWNGVSNLDLNAFRPAGVPRLFILGGCAEISRDAAAKLLRPLALIEMGTRIGQAAAVETRSVSAIKAGSVAAAVVTGLAEDDLAPGDTKETLTGVRPTQRNLPAIASPLRKLPVLGRYDVVVVGGGTAGAPAGIGASRAGAKTLLLEYLNGLGGVGTQGRIITYYYGYRGGFTAQVDAGVKEMGATNYVVGKSEWWRTANRKAGTEIWFGVLGCGAFVENGVVKGVVVATPFGRGVVLAKTVIDSSGNADIAAAAGAQCDYTAGDEVAVQGAGVPPQDLGDHYTNTDWTFADDTDPVDFWQHYIIARQKFRGAYDIGQLVQTRERRRIIGDVVITPMDIILGRTWPDTINQASSNFDTHGFTIHSLFFAMPPDRKEIAASVPLRALLPRGLDGIVVTGLGASAHRDAMPIIRMQPDVQNQGYACGYAAALVADSASTIRQVDIRQVQKHLIEIGALPRTILNVEEPLPVSKEAISAAVANLVQPESNLDADVNGVIKNHRAVATVFADKERALPVLEQTHRIAVGDEKLACAVVLGLMGQPSAADTLLGQVSAARTFDKGWNYVGMGQFGRSVSELDAYIIALGRTHDPRAVEVILQKVKSLDATSEFSHHRACAMALETLADKRAARPLADLLRKPGMTGYAYTTIEAARAGTGASRTENKPRNDSLRELILARALYRCGDEGGLGEGVLKQYAQDLRGHYARHAQAVLDERKP